MDSFRFGKSVRKVVIAAPDGSDPASAEVLYERAGQKKKGSPGLHTLDRAVRRAVDAQSALTSTYEEAHERSNLKRRDGWARDLPANLGKAARKALKKLLKKL